MNGSPSCIGRLCQSAGNVSRLGGAGISHSAARQGAIEQDDDRGLRQSPEGLPVTAKRHSGGCVLGPSNGAGCRFAKSDVVGQAASRKITWTSIRSIRGPDRVAFCHDATFGDELGEVGVYVVFGGDLQVRAAVLVERLCNGVGGGQAIAQRL